MNIFNNKKIYKCRYGVVTTAVMLVFLFWDQLLKFLTDGSLTFNILGDFLVFDSVHNYGAAYSIFSGHTVGLIIVTFVILILLLVFNWFHKKKTIFYSWSMGLILSGAVGNLIDRIFFGYVRDFIKVKIFSFTCNIADICLCIGIALFAIYIIFLDRDVSKKKTKVKVENAEQIEEKPHKLSEEDSDDD